MSALRQKPTNKKHANVLQHLLGYFKKDLTADEKQEALEVIENYAAGFVPLIVPVTLLNHYVRKYQQPYLRDQYYLNPHPAGTAVTQSCLRPGWAKKIRLEIPEPLELIFIKGGGR